MTSLGVFNQLHLMGQGLFVCLVAVVAAAACLLVMGQFLLFYSTRNERSITWVSQFC